MWLINTETLQLEAFHGYTVPRYAILSHTWSDDECSHQDLRIDGPHKSRGYDKLQCFAYQSRSDGIGYGWMDTCCIDKSSSAELSEAINSMYRWYHEAEKCYVYLEDVPRPESQCSDDDWVSLNENTPPVVSLEESDGKWIEAFRRARWFSRGWTLQELIAPKLLAFYSREWSFLGDKTSLGPIIEQITGIQEDVLQGQQLEKYSVEERLSWTRGRMTTRPEDSAYCLLGLFDVNMPLLYGEGRRAYRRLAEEIAKNAEGYKFVTGKGQLKGQEGDLLSYLQRQQTESSGSGEPTKPHSEPPEHGKAPSPQLPSRDRMIDSSGQDDHADHDDDQPSPVPPDLSNDPSLSGNQIRIISLQPGVMGEKLIGTVRTYDVSKVDPYYALSYTWGDEPDLLPIFLNGEKRLIRSNLFHALQRVRQRSGTINIWIDSICINQDDKAERTAQVRRMADIYRNATGVMIWLGEQDSLSSMAMDLIQKIVTPEYQWRGPWWQDYGFMAMSQILKRPWFHRRWVLQEAALSCNSTIYCGDRQVYMSVFTDAVNLVRAKLSTATPLDMQMNQSSPLAFLDSFRDSPAIRLLDTIEMIIRKSKVPLETLVDVARFSDTSDRRDTIYALLSLARSGSAALTLPDSNNTIEPDYDKSVLDVYADFVSHCICHSGSLDVLCRPWAPVPSRRPLISGIKIGVAQDQPLPSWIATRDRLPFGDPSLRLTQRVHGKALVDSSSKRAYTCHLRTLPQARIGRDSGLHCNGSLHVKGLILGKVVRVSMRMANAMITKDCLQILCSPQDAGSSRPGSVPATIWRTLCADRDDKGEEAPIVYRSAMAHLLYLSRDEYDVLERPEQASLLSNITSIDIEELLSTDLNDHVRTYLEIVRDVVWNRRTFQARPEHDLDKSGTPLVGLLPQAAKVGDMLCILYGCSVPVVLRKSVDTDGTDSWQMVGDAYVDGIMDGEIFEQPELSWYKGEDVNFELR